MMEAYFNPVSPVCLNGGSGELFIDDNHFLLDSIRSENLPGNIPVVFSDNTSVRCIRIRIGICGVQWPPRIPIRKRVIGHELGESSSIESSISRVTVRGFLRKVCSEGS
jgi:hypothetical protein